jgi:DNA-binding LacI/PurR family transcriptional regulator
VPEVESGGDTGSYDAGVSLADASTPDVGCPAPSTNAPRRRATSADVAREAGVSRATVSYVLNGAAGRKISNETRELVLSTAERLGHVPYAPARSLRLGRTDVVLVIVRNLSLGYVGSSLLYRLDAALAKRGYIVLVDRYEPSLRSLPVLWKMVSPALVLSMDGLSGGLPIAEQSAIEGGSERFLRLQGTPNTQVGEIQAQHLISRGHAVCGYALQSTPMSPTMTSERLQGVRRTYLSAGLQEPHVQPVDPNNPETIDRALDVWLKTPGLTAVAAHSDEIALMLCGWMTARGLTPGVDLAVIGVDDVPAAQVSLTTVAINVDSWAAQVIATTEALLDDRTPPPVSTADILKLIVRTSA